VVQQAFVLRGRYPHALVDLSLGRLRWVGTLRPLATSRAYIVSVDYRARRTPVVRVLSTLDGRPGEALPHVYDDGSLCLHERGDWSPEMLIADSIVPWAAEWLAYYEIWQATGEWHGGGEWPPVRASN
jgi:hypothetical protein